MLIFATMINDVDDRAFMQEVYQQNERLMYAIALKYASNTQDCEDIVHDTVERLCKNIIKIKGLPNSALRAYVVYAVRNISTIISNLYLKEYYQRRNRVIANYYFNKENAYDFFADTE